MPLETPTIVLQDLESQSEMTNGALFVKSLSHDQISSTVCLASSSEDLIGVKKTVKSLAKPF